MKEDVETRKMAHAVAYLFDLLESDSPFPAALVFYGSYFHPLFAQPNRRNLHLSQTQNQKAGIELRILECEEYPSSYRRLMHSLNDFCAGASGSQPDVHLGYRAL